jgi:hypothetical protein
MNFCAIELLMTIALALTGCGPPPVSQVTLQEKQMPRPNPVNYEFDAPVSGVRDAVRKALGFDWRLEEARRNRQRAWKGGGSAEAKCVLTMALQLPPGSLFFKGDADALSKHLLTQPGNENDAYFYGTDSPIGESQVYFKDGQPLIYYADFHIHLNALGPQKTRVEISTYDSSLVTGVDESWSAHGPSFIFVRVQSTTIEEYQILLGIGKQLGTKNMPQPVTPTPDSAVRQLTKPRGR